MRPDASSDAEVSVLSNVYKFMRDCHAKKEAATSPESRPNAGTRIKEDSDNASIPRPS
jgi:hypothetical protein